MVNFRKHVTNNGTVILAGRNAKNNEELVSQVLPNEDVFHTEFPGSPFVNIKGKTKRGDVKEAAIFCARYSQDWRDNKSDVTIHHFKGRNIYKEKGMKVGTFGVKRVKKIKIKKKEILEWKQ